MATTQDIEESAAGATPDPIAAKGTPSHMTPLTGSALVLGTIALFGMIMRNSVILVDQIEQDLAAGKPRWEAIVESTVRRFRPIVLTAAAAVLAMIPLSRNDFFGPMAVAIMGGLIVATGLTLLFLPALYAAWYKVSLAD